MDRIALAKEVERLLLVAATDPAAAAGGLADLEKAQRKATDPEGIATVLEARARTLIWTGNYSEALALSREGLAVVRERGRPDLEAGLKAAGGLAAIFLGREAESAGLLEEAAAEFRAQGDHAKAASALNSLAVLQFRLGELDAAERCFASCAREQRAAGRLVNEGVAWDNLGLVRTARGAPLEALACLDKSAALFTAAGDRRRLAGSRVNRAGVLIKLGRLDQADLVLEVAETDCRKTGFTAALADAARLRGELALARGEPGAEAAFRAALAQAEALGEPELRIDTLAGLARALRGDGRGTAARAALREAADLAETNKMRAKHAALLAELRETGDVA